MKRLLIDAVLIGLVAAGVWFVRGDAQVSEYPAFGQTVQIVCGSGDIQGVQVAERPMGYDFSWTNTYPLQQSLRGFAQLNDCVLYPMEVAP